MGLKEKLGFFKATKFKVSCKLKEIGLLASNAQRCADNLCLTCVTFLILDHQMQDPVVRPLHELGTGALLDILPDIPLWVKCPDYERVSAVY